MKSLLSRHFRTFPSVHLIEGVRLKEVSLLYTGTLRDFVSWDTGKYLLSIFSGVCIRQVTLRENRFDLLVGQGKLSILFSCP